MGEARTPDMLGRMLLFETNCGILKKVSAKADDSFLKWFSRKYDVVQSRIFRKALFGSEEVSFRLIARFLSMSDGDFRGEEKHCFFDRFFDFF